MNKYYVNDEGNVLALTQDMGVAGLFEGDGYKYQYPFSRLREATKQEVDILRMTKVWDLDYEDYQEFIRKSKVINTGESSRSNIEWDIELIDEILGIDVN